MRGGLVVVAVVVGCGPSVGTPDATATSSSGDASSSSVTSAASSTTSTPSTSGVGETTARAESSSSAPGASTTEGDLVDPCLSGTPPDCAADCTTIIAYPQRELSCDVDLGELRAFCISVGEPLAETYRSTYYAEIDGELWFTLVGQSCVESSAGSPLMWAECSGAIDEPQLCECLCGRDVCGWEAEAELLQGCGYPKPCPDAEDVPEVGAYSAAQICVLTALRDRLPAELVIANPDEGREQRVYVDDDGIAQVLRWFFPGICIGPLAEAWRPAERCTLAAPSYFDACLQATSSDQVFACLDTFAWFTACEPEPAACP